MRCETEQHLSDLLDRHAVLASVRGIIVDAFEKICGCLRSGGALFLCGNGGSAADAEHIAGELIKGFLKPRPLSTAAQAAIVEAAGGHQDGHYIASHLQQGLRAVALTGHPALATAMANDVGADLIFAQQVEALGRCGDVLLAISTSGNARNVRLAALVARARGMSVVALTGCDGGALRTVSDLVIAVPERVTPRVQELHLPVYHALCAMLEAELVDP